MSAEEEVAELRREIAIRDTFLARAATALGGLVAKELSAIDVEELRAFARELAIIAGDEDARTPRRTTIDAGKHVTKTVERWQTRTKGRVTIRAVIDDASDDTVGTWDPALLDTMLGELVSNACKYGGGRPVIVRVEAGVATVKLIVEDEGNGIAPGDARGARFRRGRHADHHIPGFGVGLWLTRLLAEAHGGTFHLDARDTIGTRAIVELPR